MNITSDFIKFLMQAALEQARQAEEQNEVPVGAVIACRDKIIARAHNEVEHLSQATRHAEILAIERASKITNDWRLTDCVLCVTLEPCVMCLGAIKLARVPTVVFGASDQRMGACGSLFDLTTDSRIGPVPRIISGVEEVKCSEILKNFFQKRR